MKWEGGGGGVFREKSSAALEWRPRVINKLRFCPGSAAKAAVGSARPKDRLKRLEVEPGPKWARAAALRAAAGRRIMHTG